MSHPARRHVKVNLEVTEVDVYSFILVSSFAVEVNSWAGDNEDEEKRTIFFFLWLFVEQWLLLSCRGV